MSRGYPSMTALLALLAMAGYQNRDKIAEWLGAAQRKAGELAQSPEGGAGSLPGKLGGLLAGTSVGEMLSKGLHELTDSFKQAGQGEVAELVGGTRPEQADYPRPLGDRTQLGCFGGRVPADRLVTRGYPFETYKEPSGCRGQIHAGGTNPDGG